MDQWKFGDARAVAVGRVADEAGYGRAYRVGLLMAVEAEQPATVEVAETIARAMVKAGSVWPQRRLFGAVYD